MQIELNVKGSIIFQKNINAIKFHDDDTGDYHNAIPKKINENHKYKK